ncbi:TetR/AcrR family transcriptional regulator [Bacillus sp. F19]|nr:TetR/AcrR family transcriptional regulator [Bacillus sp. F19]
MTPLNEEQLQQIRDERKEQIMEAALKVFARRGIIGTKMSMIATEAGISPGLLYRYFKSKDELFTTLVKQAIEESASEMQNVYKLPGSPIDKIRTLTEATLDENGQLYFMLIHQARTSDEVPEEAKRLIEQYSMKTYVDQLEPLFVEGQKANQIASGDPRKLISCYLAVLSGLMTLNIHEDENYQIPEVDLLMRIVTGP